MSHYRAATYLAGALLLSLTWIDGGWAAVLCRALASCAHLAELALAARAALGRLRAAASPAQAPPARDLARSATAVVAAGALAYVAWIVSVAPAARDEHWWGVPTRRHVPSVVLAQACQLSTSLALGVGSVDLGCLDPACRWLTLAHVVAGRLLALASVAALASAAAAAAAAAPAASAVRVRP